MSRLPPVPPANRPAFGPDAAPKDFADVTHRVRQQARRLEAATASDASDAPLRDDAPVRAAESSLISGVSLPRLNLAIAGFAGYVLGYFTARR